MEKRSHCAIAECSVIAELLQYYAVLLQCSVMHCYCSVIVQSAVLLRLITLGIRLAEADEMGAIGRLSAARASPSSSFNLGRFFSELYRVVFLTDPP